MKWTSWAFLAFVGALAFSVLIIADYEMDAGVDRLSQIKLPPPSALDADPNLKLISERSPYMRTER
jgi:hypothetical protein